MSIKNGNTKYSDGSADWGFEIIKPGIHKAVFGEGISLYTNDKPESKSFGKRSIKIPFKIAEDTEDNNKIITVFLSIDQEKDGNPVPLNCKTFSESRWMDIILASKKDGEFDATFGEAFCETLSPFDKDILDRVIHKMQLILPDVPVQLRIYHKKDQNGKDQADINAIASIDAKLSEVKGAGKAGKEKVSAPRAAKSDDDE